MHIRTIKLPNATEFHNLNDLVPGLSVGESVIIMNNTGSQLRIVQYDSSEIDSPSGKDDFPVWPNSTALIHGNDELPIYIRGGTDGTIVVQPLTSTILPLTGVELPQDIVTSGVEGFRRLQVDVNETGFFEAREFRMLRKIRIADTGDTQVFKFDASVDFNLFEQDFSISEGNYEFYAWRGDNATEDTAFTEDVPFFNKNISSEFRDYDGDRYQAQVSITTGGTITPIDPELYADYAEMITSNATSQKVTASSGANRQRYLAAGTYYLEFRAITGPVRGVYSIAWEERPAGVK